MARFYASVAPAWWRFQLVSLGNRRLPPKRYDFYSILLDNGMFRFVKYGRADMARWLAELEAFARDVERLRRPRELAVILPDWLGEPEITLRALALPASRRLCGRYKCLAVVHAKGGIMAYHEWAERVVEAAVEAGVDLWGLAAPLKLNCSRYSGRAQRRIIRLECQAAVVDAVCGVARKHGLKCHGLGIALKPEHVRRLVELGLDSFDSSSWTRPNNSVVARTAPWSAKTKDEKERFFRIVIQRLGEAGVELEGAQEVVVNA